MYCFLKSAIAFQIQNSSVNASTIDKLLFLKYIDEIGNLAYISSSIWLNFNYNL